MKLAPRHWTWDGPDSDALRLARCPADGPTVWQAWLTDDSTTQAYLASLLSSEERARMARFHLQEDQQRFLLGRGLLRLLVGAQLDMPAERVEFGYGQFGKPFAVSRPGVPTLHFNVSHSGKLVLLALSPVHEVGVDVEEVRRCQDWEAIARQVLSGDEHREWIRLDPEARLTAFFRAWTRHEAGLKAMGLGLADEQDGGLDACMVRSYLELPDGYQGAVGWRSAV
jgi:4'-phosphopantetheinyl transferase